MIKEVMEELIPTHEFDALVGNMAPQEGKGVPSWVEEKDRENFSNLL